MAVVFSNSPLTKAIPNDYPTDGEGTNLVAYVPRIRATWSPSNYWTDILLDDGEQKFLVHFACTKIYQFMGNGDIPEVNRDALLGCCLAYCRDATTPNPSITLRILSSLLSLIAYDWQGVPRDELKDWLTAYWRSPHSYSQSVAVLRHGFCS
ncbi:MAG: hypothetical protein LBJ92_03770 [Holosporales bacterium]|nr:hypothetical protein [Holosporales bacterium]